jgi:hypothetical protein
VKVNEFDMDGGKVVVSLRSDAYNANVRTYFKAEGLLSILLFALRHGENRCLLTCCMHGVLFKVAKVGSGVVT